MTEAQTGYWYTQKFIQVRNICAGQLTNVISRIVQSILLSVFLFKQSLNRSANAVDNIEDLRTINCT